MNRTFNFFQDNHHIILKVFFFLIAVSLIVFIFPREGKFKYEFQKGKPWQHSDLIAPFDYPIYKSSEELVKEREVVESQLKPYFFLNKKIRKTEIERFNTEFEQVWQNLSEKKAGEEEGEGEEPEFKEKTYYLEWGQNFLEKIYDIGVIELHASIEDKESDYEVLILDNNVAVAKPIGEIHTITTAYKSLKNQLTKLSEWEAALLSSAIENCLKRNVTYDAETNELMHQQELENISPTMGMIQKGERVVSEGDLINDERYKVIESLKIEFESQLGESSNFSLILLGQVILVTLLISSLAFFLLSFRKEIINSDSKIIFLLLLIVLFVFSSKLILSIENVNLYLIPFCILPLIIRGFFDIRVSLFTFLVTILIIGFVAPNPYEFIIIQMITGMLTLLGIASLKKRSQLFISSLIVFSVYCLVYISIGLVQEGTFETTNWMFLGWFFGSALLTLFAYPLIYIFEKIFGFVSDVTLMELADTNNKILRKLNMKAPGTFQHSLQVSNLAEEAIRAIGGNALLVRTGALYHDIGKMSAPNYFVENQNSDYNPHVELSPEESAAIIIEHVLNGIEIARRNNVPDIIIDFIRTHHGTTKVRFFYKQYLENHPDDDEAEKLFTYPGPNPYSKETAVLMMADSVEAASRTLRSYDGYSIENLVNSIINNQIKEGQFDNANITFKDITEIKKMFKKKLMSIYHVRVEYPE